MSYSQDLHGIDTRPLSPHHCAGNEFGRIYFSYNDLDVNVNDDPDDLVMWNSGGDQDGANDGVFAQRSSFSSITKSRFQ